MGRKGWHSLALLRKALESLGDKPQASLRSTCGYPSHGQLPPSPRLRRTYRRPMERQCSTENGCPALTQPAHKKGGLQIQAALSSISSAFFSIFEIMGRLCSSFEKTFCVFCGLRRKAHPAEETTCFSQKETYPLGKHSVEQKRLNLA